MYQTTKDIPPDLITLHKQFIQLSIKYFIIKDNEINDSISNAHKVTDASQNAIDEIPVPQLKIINTVYPVPLEQSETALLNKSNKIKINKTKSNQLNNSFIGLARIDIVRPDTNIILK